MTREQLEKFVHFCRSQGATVLEILTWANGQYSFSIDVPQGQSAAALLRQFMQQEGIR